eukprot:m.65711 g.65711  ORF g.65711 m.65711 type:complete len:1070 (-) comp9779_c0_seq1:860-4069(-)
MRLNLKHVGLIATSNPHLNVKTGWLALREKGSGSSFKERWVVLKGNFLFYFRKEVQHASELVGCILLEKFSLRVSDEREYEFAISFEQYSQSEILFRATSKEELKRWKEVLSTSCHEYTRAVHALVAKRSEAFGLKPLAFDPMTTYPDGTPMERVAFNDYKVMESLESPPPGDPVKVLKIGLAAFGLKGDRSSPLQPSCYIKVQVKYVSWIDYLVRTDVKREVDPSFASEVIFQYNESLGPKFKRTHVRFIVYMDNGASGSMRTASGSQKRDYSAFRPAALAECQLCDIVDSPNKSLNLALMSWANAAVPFKSTLQCRVVGDNLHDPAASSSGGTTVRLGKKIEGPIYKFPTKPGAGGTGVVRATEVMGESAYFRLIPESLLKVYVEEDRGLIERAAAIGDALSETAWDEHVGGWFEHINQRMKLYIDHMTTLSQHPLYFRKSVDKKSKELEMTALNCHIQRMNVLEPEGTGVLAMYDTVTHGAPAAHSLGFKHGGLRSILQKDGRKRGKWNEADAHVQQLRQIADSVATVLDKLAARFPKAPTDGGPAEPGAASAAAPASPTPSSASGASDLPLPRPPPPVVRGSFPRLPQHSGVDEAEEAAAAAAAAAATEADDEPPTRQPSVRDSDAFFGAADYAALEVALSEARLVGNLVSNEFLGSALTNTLRIRESGNGAGGQGQRTVRGMPLRTMRARDARQIAKAVNGALENVNTVKTEGSAGAVTEALKGLHDEITAALFEVDVAALLVAIGNDRSDDVVHRRDVTFSQACTCLVTSFVATLVNHRKDDMFLRQIYQIGFLVQFESLLSTQGKEMGMIEDMSVAVEDLRGVSFRLESAPEGIEPFSRVFVQGTRYRICITLEVPPPLYDRLPANVLRSGNGLIPVMPVFFTHGVNEMQTLANKLGETEVQEAIVTKGMRDLTDYCKAYSAFIERTADKTTAAELTATLSTLLGNLQAAVKADKSKNVYILTMSSDLARKMNGGRLTCCKSGKDRTGMSVTLEQARILIAKHAMEESKIQEALHLMRSMGTRMDNVEKNIGQRKYAFNKIQVYALPKLLRPPIMNIGGSIT